VEKTPTDGSFTLLCPSNKIKFGVEKWQKIKKRQSKIYFVLKQGDIRKPIS